MQTASKSNLKECNQPANRGIAGGPVKLPWQNNVDVLTLTPLILIVIIEPEIRSTIFQAKFKNLDGCSLPRCCPTMIHMHLQASLKPAIETKTTTYNNEFQYQNMLN
ncbi:hypothetical protein SLE2022_354900 [Rubroshorea leprosula]